MTARKPSSKLPKTPEFLDRNVLLRPSLSMIEYAHAELTKKEILLAIRNGKGQINFARSLVFKETNVTQNDLEEIKKQIKKFQETIIDFTVEIASKKI